MKVLFIYCSAFGYEPAVQTLEMNTNPVKSELFDHIQTAFIQIEKEDESQDNALLKKLLKNIKWICGKNKTKKILLHSFAHLSDSKATPEFTFQFLKEVEDRLVQSGFEVYQTPFGYFLDLKIQAPGFSLARVFKSL